MDGSYLERGDFWSIFVSEFVRRKVLNVYLLVYFLGFVRLKYEFFVFCCGRSSGREDKK